MKRLLPHPATDRAFYDLDKETDYAPALRVVAEGAGIDPSSAMSRFDDGSVPVFAAGAYVIKLYPPSCVSEYDNERAVLERVAGALPIATPTVHAAGALEGWRYVVMSRLDGRPLRACFDEVRASDRLRLATKLGEAVRALHALEPLELPRHDWAAFIGAQRAGCVERHRKAGLDDRWLARIEPFLDEMIPSLPVDGRHSLLHTELMREHVFVDCVDGRFELSGLLDFEPSMIGPPEYELSSVGLFFSEGDSAIWHAFLDGFGVRSEDRLELARRCMGWGLLHRYANLKWWLGRLPVGSERRSFDDLAVEWFG